MDYYSKKRKPMLKYLPDNPSKILEVGCGTGEFGKLVKENYSDVEMWGVEYNKDAANVAQDVFFKVFSGDINDIIKELPDDYFDCVVMNDVIEHLAYPEDTISAIKNKMTKDGYITASIPNFRHWNTFSKLVFLRELEYVEDGILDRTHLRFFTKSSMKRMWKRLGFRIVKFSGVNVYYPVMYLIALILFLGLFSDSNKLQYGMLVQKEQ